MDPISFQLFLKVLPELGKYTGQKAYKLIRTPVALAISAGLVSSMMLPHL